MLLTEAPASNPASRHPTQSAPDMVLLTEAQVRAMPVDGYMSSAQLNFFKIRLFELERSLVIRVRGIGEVLAGGGAVAAADPVDRASTEEEHTLAVCGRTRDASRLLEILAALRRIEEGEYGYCMDSGEPIGVERLLIEPAATLSREAQERLESKRRRFRMPG